MWGGGLIIFFDNPGFNSLRDFSLREIEGEARGDEPLAAEGGFNSTAQCFAELLQQNSFKILKLSVFVQ